jgi:hypothetical protein
MSAYFAACLMNAFASDPWRPNGGLPKNIFLQVNGCGVHSKKSPCCIPVIFGSISIPILLAVAGAWFRNAPLPADGSTHRYALDSG